MKVLGVSGSPIRNNTDSALKAALDATGMETEFIKRTMESCLPKRQRKPMP
jgi:multimeric flavodoxin WrbA